MDHGQDGSRSISTGLKRSFTRERGASEIVSDSAELIFSMEYNALGKTGMKVSRLGFGASALGGVYGRVTESEAIKAVHTALDSGINYFDVAPAYGGTASETVLGKALQGISRDRYYLSTKVGKYTKPGSYGEDTLDYSRERIRASLDESAGRLGTDYFDIIHIHDIEYQGRKHTEWALQEGLIRSTS